MTDLLVVPPGYRKVPFSAALRKEAGDTEEAPLYRFSLDQTIAYVVSVEASRKETHVLRQYRLPTGEVQSYTVPLRWPVAVSSDLAACLEQESGRNSGTIFSRSLAEGTRSEKPCPVEHDFRGAGFSATGFTLRLSAASTRSRCGTGSPPRSLPERGPTGTAHPGA